MIKRPAVFYGWVIVAIAAVTMIPVYGSRHSFSVFFPSILDEFGWSRAGTAGMYSLNILVYGMVAPIAGGFGARWDPKRVMVLGAVRNIALTPGPPAPFRGSPVAPHPERSEAQSKGAALRMLVG